VAPLHPWLWPSRPWQRIHVDFAGPVRGRNFLILVDAHSKWPDVIEMRSTTSTATIRELRQLFATFGLPEQLVSDNGPQFTSDEFKSFLKSNGVKHICSAPYHPSSNGAAERFVRTFKRAMKTADHPDLSFHQQLMSFLLAYRTTPHSTTGVTPSSLFLYRTVRTRLDLLHPEIAETVRQKQTEQKHGHDKHSRVRNFNVGQRVSVRNYRSGPKWITGTITDQLGPLSYQVQVFGDRSWRRHVDQILDAADSPRELSQSESDSVSPTLITPTPEPVLLHPQEPHSVLQPTPSVPAPLSPVPTPMSTEDTAVTVPSSTVSETVPTETVTPSTPSTERRYPLRNRKPPLRYHDIYM